MIVSKFGGSSLADAGQIKKVFNIVKANPKRKIVVVSAPGKRDARDIKITDLLISCADTWIKTRCAASEYNMFVERFADITAGLGLGEGAAQRVAEDIRLRLKQYDGHSDLEFTDLLKAAGEDNCARVTAEYFRLMGMDARYADPKECGLLLSEEFGNAQVLPESYENLAALADISGVLVFPGFFGYTKSGKAITFSRGGSDVTGSILAAAVGAELYENFTDVSNVFSVDPSIVKNPAPIAELTYREMRELSYSGFNVYHEDALIPIFNKGIPVHIKNTNRPSDPGTAILPTRKPSGIPVAGISAASGFMCISISKLLMNREIGFGRKLMQILEDEGVPFEHMPSGIDDVSIIMREGFVPADREEKMLARINQDLRPDEVTVRRGLATVMLVGEGMLRTVGTTARAAAALAHAGINIEIINQGASEVNIMFGIDAKDAAGAVTALYDEFFRRQGARR